MHSMFETGALYRDSCILPGIVYQYRLGTDGQSMNLESMQKNYLQHEKVLQSIIRLYEQEDKSSFGEKSVSCQRGSKINDKSS